MGFNSERAAIETRFRDNWGSRTKIVYENDAQAPPVDEAFVALYVLSGDSFYAGIGGDRPLGRFVGVIMINIFVPVKTGTAEARRLADVVSDIFTGRSFSGILCGIAKFNSMGGGNGPYQMNISIPFERDEEV